MTEHTFANYHDESIVWTVCAMTIFATIQGCSNEVGSWILTATINVVIFEIVAHYEPIEGVDEKIRCQYQWVMARLDKILLVLQSSRSSTKLGSFVARQETRDED